MPIRDGKNSDPGSGMERIRIRDKHPGSTTLDPTIGFRYRKKCTGAELFTRDGEEGITLLLMSVDLSSL
jgi:hypothetical protein